ncbi:hypothetical protein K402DRAFT_149128 [Aulographum hederae CBS 113979]|uniref:RNA-dependent RNA polymerase n=1 Tax=Aulographum hederae CBS 113979 TaxID=1176131 RepID=A0A6G1GTE5_9PEZI|nr:hypothetical protein K402DRAFT_149128 [Aulographum hederae CBS 113979]
MIETVHPSDKQYHVKMLLRDSQIKFQPPNENKLILRIVSTNDSSHACLFFCPLLKAIEDSDPSGTASTRIERMYQQSYNQLASVSLEGMELLREIFRVTDNNADVGGDTRSFLLKLAMRLKGDSIYPEDYLDSFLSLYLASLAKSTRTTDPFTIPIPGSHHSLGLADDNGFLNEEEVYIRAEGRTISGRVLIYRFPIIHIGDIQEANALGDDVVEERMRNLHPNNGASRHAALKSMDNVISFSLKDYPPFPNRLSGGDLDGDHFEILTEACGFWDPSVYATSPFGNYAGEVQTEEDEASSHEQGNPLGIKNDPPDNQNDASDDPQDDTESKDFDIGSVATFIGQYIRYDCFSELETTFMRLADLKRDGMNDKHVKKLAHWLSQAVDFAKNGLKVDLNELLVRDPGFKADMTPYFQRPVPQALANIYDATGKYYHSSKLLDRIYQCNITTPFPDLGVIDNSNLQNMLATVWTARRKTLARTWRKRPTSWDSVPRMSLRDQDIDARLEAAFLRKEMRDYRDYLKEQNIGESSEIDIFMRRRRDDYPRSHIRKLVHSVLDLLVDDHVVRRTSEEDGFTLGECLREDAEEVYKLFLYRAW